MNGAKTGMSKKERLFVAFELGKKHAQEWLANPNGKQLGMGRIEFQDYVSGGAPGLQTNLDALASATAMLEMVVEYSAGINHVLKAYAFLLRARPVGGCQ